MDSKKESWLKKILHMKKCAVQLFPILMINQHIRMIYEGSCTEDWSNDAEHLALITEINFILKYFKIEKHSFKL